MLIGEIARQSGVSVRMLRHYDSLALVSPSGRTSGGYREYSDEDVRRLLHVESLRTFGLSLTEVKRALDDPGFSPAAVVDDLVRKTRERMAAEEELLARLLRLRSSTPTDWPAALRIITLLRAVESESGARRQQAVLSRSEDAVQSAEALAESLLSEADANVAGALRWALARADGRGLEVLARGLESADPVTRRRAVGGIADLDVEESTDLLRPALDDADAEVREHAALALAVRGCGDAVHTLASMIAVGRCDVEAAEALGALADGAVDADEIVAALRGFSGDQCGAPTRLRVAQALAEIDGAAARDALAALAEDRDRAVAATASAVLEMRGGRGGFTDRPHRRG